MKVQQAPSPVHADLSPPEIVASAITQLKTGGTIRANAATTSKVRSVFKIEPKRLRRSQSTMSEPPPGEPSKPPLGGATTRIGACIVMIGRLAPRGGPARRPGPANPTPR